MNTTAPPPELQTLEKLREEELEQASAIQSMMTHRRASPARLLARLFAAVEDFTGGSRMTIWRRSFFPVVERRLRQLFTRAGREWA
jgi:hypothetical protein